MWACTWKSGHVIFSFELWHLMTQTTDVSIIYNPMALRKKIQSSKRVFVLLLHAYRYNWCRFFERNQNNARKWSNLANHHNIVHVMYIIIRRFSNSIRPALILSFSLSLATVTIFEAYYELKTQGNSSMQCKM